MRKLTIFKTVAILTVAILVSASASSQEIFSTTFEIGANWEGGTMGGYNEKTYTDDGWHFHSTEAVRGDAGESFGGSSYSFRDRGIFTVKNTAAVSGMSGFSFQLRDWMLSPGVDRDLNVSYDGGTTWETVHTISKEWFEDYQVYQEYIYIFPEGEMDFATEELQIVIDGGTGSNNSRMNIGQFVALGEQTAVATPSFSPAGGVYFDPVEVTITTSTSGADIYYTLNGDDPTENDMLFDTPLSISEDVTIRAKAFKTGLEPSSVAIAEYSFRNLLLKKDFEDESLTSGGWTVYDFKEGSRSWEIDDFGGIAFAKISEYQSDPPFPHSWYISPEVDLEGLDMVSLSFYSLAAFRTGEALSVKVSTDYTGSGDPTQAGWTELDPTLSPHTGGGYGNWTYSGEIDLSQYNQPVYIAFQYESDDNNKGEWQINDIMVTTTEFVESSDASLAVFNVGGMDALGLSGLIVSDPDTDDGAVLYVDDFEGFTGIEIETNHPMAEFEVTLNGQLIEEPALEDVPVEEGDVIVVEVTAENQTTKRYYKLTAEQAEEPEPGDFICNGDFEDWTDGLPDCWYGVRSNISQSNVIRFEDDSYVGSYSVQLVNTGSGHQRFTSETTTLQEGVSYQISFRVKGKGDIRTGLYDGRETGWGYAPYNDYIVVDSENWTEHSQIVTAAVDTDEAEFIFSLRNTVEDNDHILLDHVRVVEFADEAQEVETIAELRQGSVGGRYVLTGEAILTFQQDYRNQKYIQDETAAILIDDSDGLITTSYNRYDGITGISGTLGSYNNMLQFVPDQDPGPATSSGNEVTPVLMTLDAITTDDQAKLIEVEEVSFEDTGVFETEENYNITTPDGDGVFRTSFWDADYIGEPIPEVSLTIVMLVNQHNQSIQLTARDLGDFGALSSNASLAVFKIGGEDVLGLSGIIVQDPEHDQGATLYVEDLTGFTGIEAETAHANAEFEISLNGEEVDPEQMASVELSHEDVIVASVTAEDQETTRYYKVTVVEGEEPFELICNGDFENWTNGLPDCWFGDKSNIGNDNVQQYSGDPHTGSHAVQLINTSDSHRRFTSKATTVKDGASYSITFWVKGKGEIRTGLFDDRDTGFGYASYNSYIFVDSNSWSEHSQVITAANDSNIAEFIFSVRNTDEESDHLLLDNVSIEMLSEGPVEVDNIADLRDGMIGGMYTLTSEAILTFQQGYRSQKFIQDETAAIMIDDADGIITTNYDRYDGITGITGTLGQYQQMLQFMVSEDPGPATSTGNTIIPGERTLESLTSDDQAMLVKIQNVNFQTSGTFSTGTSYNLTSPDGDGIFYTNFFDADYIGEQIPGQAQDITVIVNQSLEVIQVTARDLNDFEVHTMVEDITNVDLAIYPNPFRDNLHISSGSDMERVSVIDISGRTVIESHPSMQSVVLQTGKLENGLYVIRIELTDGTLITHKILKQD